MLIDKFMSSYEKVLSSLNEIARECRVIILEEPIIVLSTLYRRGKVVVSNKYFAAGIDSIVLCECSHHQLEEYLFIEKDSWGKARIL